MASAKKQQQVERLTKILSSHDSFVLVDFTGLSHEQLSQLREKLFEKDALLHIVKNSLLLLSLRNSSYPEIKQELKGPTAVIFTTSENISPLKVVDTYAKETKSLSIKWGAWGGKFVDKDFLKKLALIPDKEVLQGKLLQLLKSPHTRLVFSLKGNLYKLIMVLNEIKLQKKS